MSKSNKTKTAKNVGTCLVGAVAWGIGSEVTRRVEMKNVSAAMFTMSALNVIGAVIGLIDLIKNEDEDETVIETTAETK